MTISRSTPPAAIVLALIGLAGFAACSTSSSSSGRDAGAPVDSSASDAADAVADVLEVLDEGVDSQTEVDSSTGPSDAAPVDAAFACANPSGVLDCGYCLTRQACITCASGVAPAGAAGFKALYNCTECNACYTSCGGAAGGCMMPVAADPCDSLGTSPSLCSRCEACAVASANPEAGAGTCSGLEATCVTNPACAQLLAGAHSACDNLP